MPGTSEVHRQRMPIIISGFAADRSRVGSAGRAVFLRGAVRSRSSGRMALSRTSWDMIHNLHRADRPLSEATDTTRTAAAIYARRNGTSAGQPLFR
jgi:hypothetical protein